MAKTGSDTQPGTAEGAAMGRALHVRHASNPVLNDDWAIHLLSPQYREQVLSMGYEDGMQLFEGFDSAQIFAINVGCLRYAEDEVERCLKSGIEQYLVLGAGFDSFALRRADLAGQYRAFEVDHPDMQALKRRRIEEADKQPAMLPTFIPVDFETDELGAQIRAAGFDTDSPAVVSWLNTLPYLTEEATAATLSELAGLLHAGSRLVLNYSADVEFTEAQIALATRLMEVTGAMAEPFRSRWSPTDFEALLESRGFRVIEHATEVDLTERYFRDREDGLAPGIPLRVVTAEVS